MTAVSCDCPFYSFIVSYLIKFPPAMGRLWMLPPQRQLLLALPTILPNSARHHSHLRHLVSPRIPALANRTRQRRSRSSSPHPSPSKQHCIKPGPSRARDQSNSPKRRQRKTPHRPLMAPALPLPPVALPYPPRLRSPSHDPMFRRKCHPKLRAPPVQNTRSIHVNFTHDNRCLGRAGAILEHRFHDLHR